MPNYDCLERIMKKLSMIAAAAAIAVASAAPVAAQENTNDPFVSTQDVVTPLLVLGVAATVIAIASASGTD